MNSSAKGGRLSRSPVIRIAVLEYLRRRPKVWREDKLMATVVLKTVGYSRVATEDCIATMLPKHSVEELDRAAMEEGLWRSALIRAVVMRYLRERSEKA